MPGARLDVQGAPAQGPSSCLTLKFAARPEADIPARTIPSAMCQEGVSAWCSESKKSSCMSLEAITKVAGKVSEGYGLR